MQFLNLFTYIDYNVLVASIVTPLALFIFFMMDGVKFKSFVALVINIVTTYLILINNDSIPVPFSGLLMECIYAIVCFFIAKRKLEILVVAPLYVLSCYTACLFGYIYTFTSYLADGNSQTFEEIYSNYFLYGGGNNWACLAEVCVFIVVCIFLILFRVYLNRQFEFMGSANGILAITISFTCCVMVSALFAISLANENEMIEHLTAEEVKERLLMYTVYIVLTFVTNCYIFECYKYKPAPVLSEKERKRFQYFPILYIITSLFRRRKKKVVEEGTKTYMQEMEVMYTEMRGFKHDLANIMSLMSGYFFSDNYDALKKYYFATVLPSIQEVTIDSYRLNQLANIKNEAIKSIVYNKVSKAHASGVNVSIEIIEPIESFYIGDIDLARILGIFFDNALEALSEAPEKELIVSFIKANGNICIIIANTFVPSKDVSIGNIDKKGISSKGKNRGMGLYNVSKILAKYPYIYKTTRVNDKHFVQRMEINKRKLKETE